MKRFCAPKLKSRRGFSLVEGVFSVGVISFGFLSLAPLLVLGLKTARVSHESHTTAQIAAGLIEQAKEGTPVSAASLFFDSVGQPVASGSAAYSVQQSEQTSGSIDRLTLRITPLGRPGAVWVYAEVFPAPAVN